MRAGWREGAERAAPTRGAQRSPAWFRSLFTFSCPCSKAQMKRLFAQDAAEESLPEKVSYVVCTTARSMSKNAQVLSKAWEFVVHYANKSPGTSGK